MARGVGGGGRLFEGAIILNISIKGGRLIEGRLLFEEIRYVQSIPSPQKSASLHGERGTQGLQGDPPAILSIFST